MQRFKRVVKSIVLIKHVIGLEMNVRITNVSQHQLQRTQMLYVTVLNQDV